MKRASVDHAVIAWLVVVLLAVVLGAGVFRTVSAPTDPMLTDEGQALNDELEWSFPQIAAVVRGSWELQFGKSLEEST